jgi:hypothetical protein
MRNPTRIVVIALGPLAGTVACGGTLTEAGGNDGGAADVRSADAAAPSAQSGLDAGGDAGFAMRSGLDAGDDASCTDLENTASEQFSATTQRYLACSSDSDCMRIRADGAGECVDPCGDVLTNEAGASALPLAATVDCQAFLARGCKVQVFSCLGFGNLTFCASGTCDVGSVSLSTMAPTLVHGACAAFDIQFITGESSTALAPHDFVFAMTTTNGTLYSDPTCTIPTTNGTVTLPAGAHDVAFGFEPLEAGQSRLDGVAGTGTPIGGYFEVQ